MGLLDRARRLFLSPADRRLLDAEAEAWSSAPAPSRALAIRTAASAPVPATPPINWRQDQPPPPSRYAFAPGYSDHVYQQYSAPIAFEGFHLERIRSAVAMHRLGFFFESSALMVAILGFAPVLAGLQQAIAPILALPRHVHGGEHGLAKLVAAEVEEQLGCAQGGLMPSPYLQPTIWGTLAIYLRMLGFAVLQHVDGDPDPVTGVRPRYTRLWEPWALQWYRSPRKLLALTTEGPVEVRNDGKFTLVADEQEPHLSAAICALGEETLGGRVTQEARLSFLDFFGKPKLWAELPEKVATRSEAGDAFFNAVETIYGPDGRGILPHGSNLQAVAITGEGSKAFQEAILDHIIHIYMVLTGSAGTIGAGGATGAGPYQPQKGGPWNVRHDLIARPTIAIVRAINQGHVAPFCDQNYAEGIAAAKAAGDWKYPVLEIPIPAPDREERLAAEAARYKAFTEQLMAERAAGAIVDQARVDKLAKIYEVQPFQLADGDPKVGEIFAYHLDNKLVAPDEVRARLGLPPLPDGAGSVERLAQERLAGADEPGALAKVEAAEVKKAPAADVPAVPPPPADAEPTTQRSRPAP